MKAIGYKIPGPIDRENSLQDIELDIPKAKGRDLLIKVNAVSINPADTKLRKTRAPEGSEWRVLGFDAAARPMPKSKVGLHAGKLYLKIFNLLKVCGLYPLNNNPALNYFGVGAPQPLSVWRKKEWIQPQNPRSWFQWFCRSLTAPSGA